MQKIPLAHNIFSRVDDEDYDYLIQWDWHLSHQGYVVRSKLVNGELKTLLIHRVIAARCGVQSKYIDHQDRDRLNNCRSNLRAATNSQNMANRGKNRNNTSGFKGVYWDKRRNRWFAAIKVNGRFHSLGFYDDKITAAKAYNEAALKYFGEFAYQNKL